METSKPLTHQLLVTSEIIPTTTNSETTHVNNSNPSDETNSISNTNVSAALQTAINNSTTPQVIPQQPISVPPGTKYNHLLAMIEELGKEIRPTYTGNRNSTEKLKRAIGHARILARECVLEVEKNARQQQ